MRSNVDEAPRPHGEGVSVQENPFLEVRDIVKNFGGVRALDGVNMAVWPGEVLCLAGENGCGKSTLIKVISGVHAPDAGRILIDGHTVSSLTPLSAMDAGIQVIYQDFSLFSNLTVAENIMMTSSVTEKKKLFSSTNAKKQAAQIVERLGVPLPLDADVEQLSVADKQLTAICRALAGNAKLLIMDEPTTALTQREVARLLRDGGVWRLATDWDDYAWQMRDVIEACELFENPHAGERPDPEDPQPERGGFAPRFEGRVVTHFETRGIDAGRHAHDIVGIRRPRG